MANPYRDKIGRFSTKSGAGSSVGGRRPGQGSGATDKYVASTDDLGSLRGRLSNADSGPSQSAADYNASLAANRPRPPGYAAQVAKARATPRPSKDHVWSASKGAWTIPNEMPINRETNTTGRGQIGVPKSRKPAVGKNTFIALSNEGNRLASAKVIDRYDNFDIVELKGGRRVNVHTKPPAASGWSNESRYVKKNKRGGGYEFKSF